MDRQVPHHRRSIRLSGYDYSQPGTYFLTICAVGHKCLFGRIHNGSMQPNKLGIITQDCWREIPEHFPQAQLHAFVVMPNHVHGIIVLGVGARCSAPLRGILRVTDTVGTKEAFGRPTIGSIPTIIRTFMAAVSRKARKGGWRGEFPIWQGNYYERVLRDGQEFDDASRYIFENPLQWEFDRENPVARKETS